jgi:general secretion pathway protein D
VRGTWTVTLVTVVGMTVGARWLCAQDVPTSTPPAPAEATEPSAPSADEFVEPDQPLGDEEAMVLNFERADIREVIHSLATALGISYTIDPRIEGQVTIRTTGRISRADLFPLFNQILRNNGIAAVKVGEVYQILPVAEAKTRAIVPKTKKTELGFEKKDEFAIEIISLKHVTSDEMANILQPFVTPGGDVLSYPRANLLVVTDLQSNIDRIRSLVQTFDTNVFRDLHARVFKVVHGDPEELANEVLLLLSPYGVTPTGDGESGTFVVPLQRLSAIVVIAEDPSVFDEFGRWLKMLDIPPEESAGRQTFVYNVENLKAADLAAVLNELFGESGGTGSRGFGRAAGTPAGIGLFGAGGVQGGTNRPGARRGLRGAGQTGVGAGIRQQAGGLRGGDAGDVEGLAVGQQVGGALGGGTLGGGGSALGSSRSGVGGGRRGGIGGGGVGGGIGGAGGAGAGIRGVSLPGGAGGPLGQEPPPVFKQEVRIVADEVTNSLIMLATRKDYQLIVDVLRKIDVVPRQVLLEVTIAEVRLTKNLEFGVQWAIAEGHLGANNLPLVASDAVPSVFRTGPTGLPVGGFLGEASRVPSTPNTAFAVISDREHFNLFINALAARTNVKMLSAPHIIAADNREAHILIGESVPILTQRFTSVNQDLVNPSTVNSVQYRDTGKILTVLPQVNSKGLVNMQIRQEVSAVASQSFGQTGSPSFSTREAETTMVVQDGESVLIGGIIDDVVDHSRRGVPFLMDIPVIGRAFRSESDNLERTELMVLITPYVIRSRDEARDVTDTLVDRVEGLRRLQRALHPRRGRARTQDVDDQAPPGADDRPAATPRPAAEPPTDDWKTP